jgi:hypothetical protein
MRRYDSNLENAVLAFFIIEVGFGGRPLPGRAAAAVKMRGLARFELAFLHHALMLLAFAFDAVLIIAFAVRELPNHFVEAAGCVLIKIAAAQTDSLPATEFMDHMKLRSRAHPAHDHPIVAAGGAQPMMVEELLTAMGGSRRRNRCRYVADRTTSAAIFALGPRRWSSVRTPLPAAINLTSDVDRICLAHGCVPLQGGSTTGLSAIGARIKSR